VPAECTSSQVAESDRIPLELLQGVQGEGCSIQLNLLYTTCAFAASATLEDGVGVGQSVFLLYNVVNPRQFGLPFCTSLLRRRSTLLFVQNYPSLHSFCTVLLPDTRRLTSLLSSEVYLLNNHSQNTELHNEYNRHITNHTISSLRFESTLFTHYKQSATISDSVSLPSYWSWTTSILLPLYNSRPSTRNLSTLNINPTITQDEVRHIHLGPCLAATCRRPFGLHYILRQ
jgi:hypothetical protein